MGLVFSITKLLIKKFIRQMNWVLKKTYLCKPGFNSPICLVQRPKKARFKFLSDFLEYELWKYMNNTKFCILFFQIREFSFIKIIGFDATLLFHLYTMWLSVCIFGQNWFSTGQTVTIQLLWSFRLSIWHMAESIAVK